MSTSKKKNFTPKPAEVSRRAEETPSNEQQLQIRLTKKGPDLIVEVLNPKTQEFEQIADDRAEIALAKLNSEIYAFRFLGGSSND